MVMYIITDYGRFVKADTGVFKFNEEKGRLEMLATRGTDEWLSIIRKITNDSKEFWYE